MPIAIDPNRTFEITLDSDSHKPEAERPAFIFRFLTGREWIALSECVDKLDGKIVTAAQMLRQLDGVLSPALKGWRNIAIAYAGNNLLDVANPAELYELAGKVMQRIRIDGADLKKSA